MSTKKSNTNNTTSTSDTESTNRILDKLVNNVYIPDDTPEKLSVRDTIAVQLIANSELHRVHTDGIHDRINRCIHLADVVLDLLSKSK